MTKLFLVAVLAAPGLAAADGPTDAARPHTLGNGRPACGNVMGKGERRSTCEPAAPVLAAQPRVLPNGRPACGNVMGKNDEPRTACESTSLETVLATASTPPASAARPARPRKAARTRTAAKVSAR